MDCKIEQSKAAIAKPNVKLAIMLGFLTLMLSTMTGTAAYADSGNYAISQKTLTFYDEMIVERYESFQENPMEWGSSVIDPSAPLEISDGENSLTDVSWKSSDETIAQVDANGNVTPISFGTATITGTCNGKTYSCTVFVKEMRFYWWQEYTGDPSSSRWIWDNSTSMCVGQTVPYKLVEITYGKDKKVSSKKNVTNAYPLTPEGSSHVQVKPGSITALKGGTDQFDLTSGVHYVIENTGVPYVQMVRFHVFTDDWSNCKDEIGFDNSEWNEITLTPNASGGTFSLDDEFLVSADWSFRRLTTKELTWKSSDTSILTIDSVIGSRPLIGYSTARYTVHKKGKVTLSVLVNGKKIASTTFVAVPDTRPEQALTVKPQNKTVSAKAAAKKNLTVSKAFSVKSETSNITYNRVSKGSSKNLSIDADTGKITIKKGTKAGTYKIKVIVTAAGDLDRKDGSKTVTVKITVAKAKQPLTVKANAKTVRAEKTSAADVILEKSLTVKKAMGKVTYKKIAKGSSKYLTINKKTGKIAVKKGTGKGTYKIKVSITAAGDALYSEGSKTVTVKVRVK